MPVFKQQPVPTTSLLQNQKLVLSPKMQQALAVLRMPLYEMREYIYQELINNPLLEIEPSHQDEPLNYFTISPLPSECLPDTTQQIWEEQVFAGVLPTFTAAKTYHNEYSAEVLYDKHPSQNLASTLLEQLAGITLDKDNNFACEYLIDCLDRRGYLAFPLEELADITGISIFNLTQALFIVQSFTPTGVAARNLQECLILQLVQGEFFNAYTIKLVKEGLPLLADNNIKSIAKLLECPEDSAEKWANIIRSLNPIPAQGYAGGDNLSGVVPDAAIVKEGGRLVISLNKQAIPKLELNPEYCAMLKGKTDDYIKNYLRKMHKKATNLLWAVNERETTLLRILTSLATLQAPFFSDGKPLVPMTMADLSAYLDLHVSTISRAIQDKYIVCNMGTISLKSLFTSGILSSSGEISSTAVQQKIEACIKAEDATNPLSDESLHKALELMGIHVSRRTIAKYREEMGIPPSSKRRRRT